MEELKRELSEIEMEGRITQGKLETSMASIKGPTEESTSKMTALMAQRDRQADDRVNFIPETMHRRDRDVDNCMVDLITTVQDLTLGIKSIVATALSCPSPVPVTLNPAKVSLTSASPPQQPTNKEIKQHQRGTKPDQKKQPKVQPLATYKKMPVKAQDTTANHIALPSCEISDPPSFDPYA